MFTDPLPPTRIRARRAVLPEHASGMQPRDTPCWGLYNGPMISLGGGLFIPESELTFTVSRSSGPGGQHVNKTSTRVTLWFDVASSPSLTPGQKDRIRKRLSSRVSGDGVLRVSAQRHRSQAANRKWAVERFAGLMGQALAERPPRRRTAVPSGVKRRRLEEKKERGKLKQLRSPRLPADD
jgi:ribosome-associated protein